VADRHDGVVFEAGPAPDDRRVVAEGAIPVQLDEVGESETNLVGSEGAPRIARYLNPLKGREIPVDLFAQVRELPLERLDRLGDAELTVARRLLDLVDLTLQLGDGLLEFKLCR
jgi:hypothetical protein